MAYHRFWQDDDKLQICPAYSRLARRRQGGLPHGSHRAGHAIALRVPRIRRRRRRRAGDREHAGAKVETRERRPQEPPHRDLYPEDEQRESW